MDDVRTGLLAGAGWLVAAALTVGVSWSAISVVREAVVPQAAVAPGLPTPEETRPATTGPPAGGPAGTATATPTARPGSTAGRVVLATGRGGTATVRCSGGVPEFVNLVPQQGYRVDRDDSGTEVEFSSPDHRTEITASCAGGIPRASVEEKGGRGGGSDRSGGGDG